MTIYFVSLRLTNALFSALSAFFEASIALAEALSTPTSLASQTSPLLATSPNKTSLVALTAEGASPFSLILLLEAFSPCALISSAQTPFSAIEALSTTPLIISSLKLEASTNTSPSISIASFLLITTRSSCTSPNFAYNSLTWS